MILKRDIWLYCSKTNYETRGATFIKDFEGVTYTYRLQAKYAAKQLLITVQSISLIPDGELVLYFRRFSVLKNLVGQSHSFNHQIDSDLRSIIVLMTEVVEARDIPRFMTTLDCIRRKLLFQGKLFYCGICHSKHTFHETCPPEHEVRSINVQ